MKSRPDTSGPSGGKLGEKLAQLASLPLLLIVWQAAASLLAHRLFPTPIAVGEELWRLASSGPLIADLLRTLGRAVAAFCLSMLVGTLGGLLLGRFPLFDRLFSGWLIVGLNLPAIIVGILLYVWLGLTEWALVLAVVLNKTPLVMTVVREGVRALDPAFDELARAFRMPLLRRLRLVLLPQLLPFLLAAGRNGLALIWKIVLVFEVLGSDGGVGYRLGVFFQFFDITGILAYAGAFMLVVLAIEYGLVSPAERRATRWQS